MLRAALEICALLVLLAIALRARPWWLACFAMLALLVTALVAKPWVQACAIGSLMLALPLQLRGWVREHRTREQDRRELRASARRGW